MSDVMIQASSLSKEFGSVRALDSINFEVRKGEVVGFLGPNGAGKSTTMRILTCFISPTSGQAKVHGYDVFDRPLDVRRSLGYLPQRAPLYQDMNVWEYLEFSSQSRGLDHSNFKNRLKKVVDVCGLAQVLGKPIGTLSHGYRQRVGLGQALIHDPPILILDEPTADLDPNEIGKDRTILLSTHNLNEVEQACGRAIIVSKGRLVADGPLDEIRAKSGSVQYTVVVDEQQAENGKPGPSAEAVKTALTQLPGSRSVAARTSDERVHRFIISGDQSGDLRADLFRLMVDKGWTLLELQRDVQSLGSVFRELTRGDERRDRGRDDVAPEGDPSATDDAEQTESASTKEEN